MFFLRCGDLEILSLPFSVRNLVRRSSLSSCMENIRAASRTATGRSWGNGTGKRDGDLRAQAVRKGSRLRECGRSAARAQGESPGERHGDAGGGRSQGGRGTCGRGEEGAPGKTGRTQGKKGMARNGAGREWYPGESPGERRGDVRGRTRGLFSGKREKYGVK